MTLNVSVTQEDIRLGRRETCWACPVARAANRAGASKGLLSASVGRAEMRFTGTEFFPLPPAVVAWIHRYDDGMQEGPISFQLDVIEKHTGERPR